MNIKFVTRFLSFFVLAFYVSYGYGQTLTDVVKYTLQNNPEVLISLTERLRVAQQVKQSQAGFKPEINLRANVSKEGTRSLATGNKHKWLTTEDITLAFVQNLFRGFETYHSVSADKQRLSAAGFQVDNTNENISQLAIQSYLNVLSTRTLVEVNHSKTARLISLRSSEGVSRASERQQAEGRLALSEANLDAEINNAQDAEAIFQ